MLVIIRGLPGSGKSTLAEKFHRSGFAWYEADMYFTSINGDYNFDGGRIKDAHFWCQNRVKESLASGENVVVSNTFTRLWEMEPYLSMIKALKSEVIVIRCGAKFPSIHGVSDEAVARMANRWEHFQGEYCCDIQ